MVSHHRPAAHSPQLHTLSPEREMGLCNPLFLLHGLTQGGHKEGRTPGWEMRWNWAELQLSSHETLGK